jgi:hypothetical protein
MNHNERLFALKMGPYSSAAHVSPLDSKVRPHQTSTRAYVLDTETSGSQGINLSIVVFWAMTQCSSVACYKTFQRNTSPTYSG